jgi:DNA-binding GntR family transcriptional regulator
VVVEYAFLPPECGRDIPMASLASGVIDDLMRQHCRVNVDRGDEILSLANLDRANAAHLGARPGQPAFLVTRTAYAGDRPVQFRRSFIRADRARFRVRLAGAALEGGELAPRLEPTSAD